MIKYCCSDQFAYASSDVGTQAPVISKQKEREDKTMVKSASSCFSKKLTIIEQMRFSYNL